MGCRGKAAAPERIGARRRPGGNRTNRRSGETPVNPEPAMRARAGARGRAAARGRAGPGRAGPRGKRWRLPMPGLVAGAQRWPAPHRHDAEGQGSGGRARVPEEARTAGTVTAVQAGERASGHAGGRASGRAGKRASGKKTHRRSGEAPDGQSTPLCGWTSPGHGPAGRGRARQVRQARGTVAAPHPALSPLVAEHRTATRQHGSRARQRMVGCACAPAPVRRRERGPAGPRGFR